MVSRNIATRHQFAPNAESRILRGRRIAAVLRDFGGVDLPRATVLDVGCSAGLVTSTVARVAGCTIGIDTDVEALGRAAARTSLEERVAFVAAAGESLPFATNMFDVAICNHVYEHARDPSAMMREISRVLRRGGVCYFAAGHSLQFLEPHHRLPFLSVLPRNLANRYVRLARGARSYEEHFVAPWQLRRLFTSFGQARFISAEMLAQWERYEMGPQALRRFVGSRLPVWMAAVAARLAPTYLWLLHK